MSGFTAIVDPGHGGPDKGNCHNGVEEAPLVYSVAADLVEVCGRKEGWDACLSRDEDEDPWISTRDHRARKLNADFVLSIHADAGKDRAGTLHPDWRGAAVFHCSTNRTSGLVAEEIAKSLPQELWADSRAGMARLVHLAVGDNRYPRAVNVVFGFTAPTVLVELGYLTHRGNAAYLKSRESRLPIVSALLTGMGKAAELYAGGRKA